LKIALRLGLAAIPLFAAASLLHPCGPVKRQRSTSRLLSGARIPSDIAGLFERSCANCHSEKTEWPWYSYAPPMSWLIERDVKRAREHMNLSRWDGYTEEQQIGLLARIGGELRTRRMPLPSYLKLHPSARLSDDEVERIYQWTRSERRRLKAALVSKPGTD
jgi:hypothetical protein